jgi:hypothetical protein
VCAKLAAVCEWWCVQSEKQRAAMDENTVRRAGRVAKGVVCSCARMLLQGALTPRACCQAPLVPGCTRVSALTTHL